MSDFVLILTLLYYWPFSGYALVLAHASENPKNNNIKLVNWAFGASLVRTAGRLPRQAA